MIGTRYDLCRNFRSTGIVEDLAYAYRKFAEKIDQVCLNVDAAPGEECVEVTKDKFASLEQSSSAVEHEIFAFLEARSITADSYYDVRAEREKILHALSESDFLVSCSPALINVDQAKGQQPYIGNAWIALGYACAASLLIQSGRREVAWSALLEAKELLLLTQIDGMRGHEVLTLDQRQKMAIVKSKDNGTLMREFVAAEVRSRAGASKWKSDTEAARAVIDDAVKYGEVAYGVFRDDYPITTLKKWLKTDPIVSKAFWATCEPEVKADFERKRRLKKIRGG